MRKWLAVAFVCVLTLLVTRLWVHAQRRIIPFPPPGSAPNEVEIPQIISGSDIGFRVEGWNKDGTPLGRIVVHQDGKWLDVTLSGRVRPLTTN
jgi:hypothetical protein